ncbi:MAG: hypothetical protein GVY19_08585 [Bacteroidetes bacterium]|jgi:hypothetical protein|nr:hypothetical protein [Bacteroidota bacterium]
MARQVLPVNKIGIYLIGIFWAVGIFDAHAQNGTFVMQPGDLLFQDIDCGELCDAIETVTKGKYNSDLSHIGIADTLNGQVIVLEAVSSGVMYTSLDSFLQRSTDTTGNPKVFVGRLHKEYHSVIPHALTKARNLIGRPYDNIYDITDSSYYCSELVYFAYQDNQQSPLFQLWPMTFKAPGDTAYFPSWKQYYQSLNHPVPQGKPGLNPGSISLSDKLEIVHIYGYPAGWKKTNNP